MVSGLQSRASSTIPIAEARTLLMPIERRRSRDETQSGGGSDGNRRVRCLVQLHPPSLDPRLPITRRVRVPQLRHTPLRVTPQSTCPEIRGKLTFIGTTSAATIVLAAAGYPLGPVKGDRIDGIDAECEPSVVVFHAGTEADAGGTVVAGGRVFGVTTPGTGPGEAVNRAYRAIEQISWPGMQFRTDTGKARLEA